jgi:hypothetical protein
MEMPEDLEKLIAELLVGTNNGQITWQEPHHDSHFEADLDEGLIVDVWQWSRTSIDEYDNEQTQDVVVIELKQPDKERDIIRVDAMEGERGYLRLRALHQAALMKARDVSGLIKGVMARLKDKKGEPTAKPKAHGGN